MATPMDEASKRCGSWVEFSATTANTTSPGCRYFSPWERGTSLQLGGKIEETRTRFCAAMPASRRASSKDVSRSRCFPTPLVKKIRLGTMSLPNSFASRKSNRLGKSKSNTVICEVWMKNQKNFPREAKNRPPPRASRVRKLGSNRQKEWALPSPRRKKKPRGSRGCSRRESDLSGGFLGHQGARGFSWPGIRHPHLLPVVGQFL